MTVHGLFGPSPRAVHVWPVRVEAPEDVAASYESILAPDELDRAARFRLTNQRKDFVITRCVLRSVLGRYLGMHPARVRFVYGSKGKPAISPAFGIQFNLAHSGAMVVIAVAAGCPVGIDLEYIRRLPDLQDVAARFFCAEEFDDLKSLLPGERQGAFFRGWTRKEAFVKASGEGLSEPLDGFRVTIQPREPARLVHIGDNRDAAKGWTLHDLFLAPDYAAALAYPDRACSLTVFPMANSAELLSDDFFVMGLHLPLRGLARLHGSRHNDLPSHLTSKSAFAGDKSANISLHLERHTE